MKVHHLNCATMHPYGGRLIDGAPGLMRTGWMVCHVLLIETDAGLVLVDTGLGTRDVARPVRRLGVPFLLVTRPVLDREETAVRQLARLGYAPEDVRHIVLTHLDLDHAGGLADFPHATVHVSEAEYLAATQPPTWRERLRYRTVQWAHGPNWARYETTGEPWFGFDAVRTLSGLPEEILLIPLAGHSPGHAGVAVDTGDGWLLHAGDAYFFHGEVDPAYPSCPQGLRWFQSVVEHERAARLANQDRLRKLVAEHRDEVRVCSAHDPLELDRDGDELRGQCIRVGCRLR